jgi:hypothetical protein
MIISAIAILGMALATCFMSVVLFAAMFVSAALIAGAAAAQGSRLGAALFTIALSAAALQVGFLGGLRSAICRSGCSGATHAG